MDYFRRDKAPKADELRNLCMETIQKLSAQYSSSSTKDDRTEDYLMNRHQCIFLVGRLTETQDTLKKIQLSPLLDEKTIPVLKELHQVLLDMETVINASCITSSQWPRAAIEQSDMKETFASLLYGVQWHASVLLSIFVDNFQESSITFEPALCEGQLSMGDKFSLLTAKKKDEESLKDRLRCVKLDDPTEKRLAKEFLDLKMPSEEEDHLNIRGERSPPDLLFLNPQDIDLNGTLLGRGGYGEVKRMNLMGGKYAIKILSTPTMSGTEAFDQEMTALQRLGHHPHIVRLLCYSKDDTECYLVMEEMDKDLYTLLRNYRKKNKFTPMQAVALMLQIGEGVKYIHSKGMAHRDLKCGNILVNLANPSSKRIISSVKIADFGLTKTKNATHTYSNQTVNLGTNNYMAPEVIHQEGDPECSRFNLRKADVYSFAIICFEILTGEDPYYGAGLPPKLMKKQVKAGTLRPNLPKDCPPKLAALISRCWHPSPHERPLFPEICKELRYIKGLLLRGDWSTLEVENICPDNRPDIRPLGPGLGPLERVQIQGPWGSAGGGTFFDVGTSINRMRLTYQSPGILGSMEMDYNFAGWNLVRKCHGTVYGDQYEVIVFDELSEFIMHISGYVSKTHIDVLGPDKDSIDVVTSLTIHTNIKSYGPFGDEKGEAFASGKGRVIGFHGGSGYLLDRLGVVIILGDTN